MSWRRIFVIAWLALSGCEPQGISLDWNRLEQSVAAPEFALPQLGQGTMRLSDHRGRVVVMEFWATWCEPCRFSLPSLELIYQRYQGRGVSILLVNEGEDDEKVRAWTSQRFTAPVLLDRDHQVGRRYNVQGIPRLFVIDQRGQIVYMHEGYGGGLERNLGLILDELLAATPA